MDASGATSECPPRPDPARGAGRRGRLLAGLDEAQRRAVTSEAAPLCILAGAGSGKTRVLTRRIAWRITTGSALARHVVALTFTRRAASELGERLAALGVRDRVVAGTFHSVAWAQLRQHWTEAGQRPPHLAPRKSRLLVPLLPRSGTAAAVADVAAEIEWAKARLVDPPGYPVAAAGAGRRPPLPFEALAEVYERYEAEKRRRHVVDFDDLLILAAAAVEADPAVAAAQRWRLRHLFVDEFQDVNPAQLRVLRAWLGDRPDLCVVGDPNQAIYAWNGADPSYLADFGRWFPGAATVRLDHNYRSTPQVLAVAAAVAPTGGRLRAHQPDGPLPGVTAYADDRDEAAGIARALRQARARGRAWSACAVLARTHGQLVLFEEALRAAGVPCRVRGSAPFLGLPEVRAAMGDLRRRPRATPLAAAVPDLADAAGGTGPEGGAAPPGAAAERQANLHELLRLAHEHLAADPGATVEAFLGWLAASFLGEEGGPGADAVDLATLHAAKGLEWPVVFLAGLEQGLVPIGHAATPEARAEERRLLYVGVTRAEGELHASWARRRTFGTRTMTRSPSPYLARVEAAIAALAEGGPAADWRRHLAEGRRRVAAAEGRPTLAGSNADPRVLAALRAWRSAAARASCVPPHVVLHDTTLAAVAEARPADREALLALPGVGPRTAERYGPALLAVLAQAG